MSIGLSMPLRLESAERIDSCTGGVLGPGGADRGNTQALLKMRRVTLPVAAAPGGLVGGRPRQPTAAALAGKDVAKI